MQRINYFTNPNFTGPFININSYGGAKASYNTSTKQLNISGDNCGYGFNLSVPADVDLVFACFLWTDAAKNNGPFCVYKVNDGNSVTIIGGQKVTQNATNLVYRFHSPANGRIRIEFYPNGQPVNIANPIVELADTYDKAVGGGFRASSPGIRCRAPNPFGGGGMTPIVNHCVMPKDGVSVKTTNTTPSDITFTGLTAGVKYHVSVVCYMLSTSGDNPRLRLTTNGSDSGLVTSNGRVDYVFTAASTTHGILVGLNNCTVNLSKGLCVPQDQWQQLVSLGLPGNYFDGDTMPKD